MSSDKKTKPNAGKNDNHSKSRKLFNLFNPEGEDWLSYEDAEGFLNFIMPPDEEDMTPLNTLIKYKKVSFYKDVMLISVSNLLPEELPEDEYNIFFLKKDDHVIMLDGDGAYIHEMNETGALNLNSDTVFDYLKFFCALTLDEETMEPFHIIEGPESEFLHDISEYAKTRIMRGYTGARLISSADNKNFMIETRVIFDGNLFDAKFKITNKGEVIMTDDVSVGVL